MWAHSWHSFVLPTGKNGMWASGRAKALGLSSRFVFGSCEFQMYFLKHVTYSVHSYKQRTTERLNCKFSVGCNWFANFMIDGSLQIKTNWSQNESELSRLPSESNLEPRSPTARRKGDLVKFDLEHACWQQGQIYGPCRYCACMNKSLWIFLKER